MGVKKGRYEKQENILRLYMNLDHYLFTGDVNCIDILKDQKRGPFPFVNN